MHARGCPSCERRLRLPDRQADMCLVQSRSLTIGDFQPSSSLSWGPEWLFSALFPSGIASRRHH
eukprot:10442617-Alexandrium_andersonii.AAC.1